MNNKEILIDNIRKMLSVGMPPQTVFVAAKMTEKNYTDEELKDIIDSCLNA